MVTLTNIPEQSCVSVTSRRESCSSVSSVSEHSSMENPFSILVDAATNLFDARCVVQPKQTSPSLAKQLSSDEDTPRRAVSPVSVKIPMDVEVVAETPATSPSASLTRNNKNKDAKKQTFAELLMSVLEDPVHEEIMGWMPDGMAFTIRNHKRFTLELMPKVFNIRNMSSFVRKLGRWGFQRVHEKETRNSDIFKHPEFQRGSWETCKSKVKCVGRSQAADAIATTSKPATPTAVKPCFRPYHSCGSQRKSVVIDLVGHTSGSSSPNNSSHRRASASAMMMRRIPSPPFVTPQSEEKAMYRLEHARRMSAQSRPTAFYAVSPATSGSSNDKSSSGNGKDSRRSSASSSSNADEVVEAALETLRRDEETVLVAMPKSYFESARHHAPGMRVLSSPYHQKQIVQQQVQQQQQQRSRSSMTMPIIPPMGGPGRVGPVSLNTRPTNNPMMMHMAAYHRSMHGMPMHPGRGVVPHPYHHYQKAGWAMKQRSTSTTSPASNSNAAVACPPRR